LDIGLVAQTAATVDFMTNIVDCVVLRLIRPASVLTAVGDSGGCTADLSI
jgi:hypothetical protein